MCVYPVDIYIYIDLYIMLYIIYIYTYQIYLYIYIHVCVIYSVVLLVPGPLAQPLAVQPPAEERLTLLPMSFLWPMLM